MQRVYLGTYHYKGEPLTEALKRASASGVDGCDTAISYGNHSEIMEWLKDNQRPGRVTTKIGKKVSTIEEELERCLELTHVDRILMHHVVPLEAYLKAAKKIVARGLSVGVSNYNSKALHSLMTYLKDNDALELKPVVNQFELHPFVRCLDVVQTCREYGIEVQAHSIFLSGLIPECPDGAVSRYAKELGVTPHVILLGWAKEKCDSMCLATRNEAHWNELIQAVQNFRLPKAIVEALDQMGEACGNKYRKYGIRKSREYTKKDPKTGVSRLPHPEKMASLIMTDPQRVAILFPNIQTLHRSPEWKQYSFQVAMVLFNVDLQDRYERIKRHLGVTDSSTHELRSEKVSEVFETSLLASLARLLNGIRRELDDEHKHKRERGILCCLRRDKEGFEDAVTKPEPMPVTVSKKEELEPFFKLLRQGPNFLDSDCAAVEERGTLFADGRMDLCKQVVGPTHLKDLVDAVISSPFAVKHFLLGNNIACHVDANEQVDPATHFARLIEKKLGIETLYLAGNEIAGRGAIILTDALMKYGEDVKAVWLKRNPLCTLGATAFGQFLSDRSSVCQLRVLDLHNCGLLDEGLRSFCTPLASPCSLRHLYLDANGLTHLSMPSLVQALRNMPDLRSLFISLNAIGDEGLRVLMQGSLPIMLRSLCLASNNLSDDIVEPLIAFLRPLRGLKALDLGCYKSTRDLGMKPNAITEKGLAKLTDWLCEETCPIQFFDVKHNAITDQTVLLSALARLNSVSRPLSVNAKQSKWKENFVIRKHTKPEIRKLKHTRRVVHIDSVYRGKM